LRDTSSRKAKSRPSEYFWKKAIGDSPSEAVPQGDQAEESNDVWLDSHAPALSDSENESTPKANKSAVAKPKKKRFTKIRRIAFKAFIPKSDGTSHQNNIVTSTEIICRQEKLDDLDEYGTTTTSKASKRMSIFNSWKFKSNGTKTQVQKMVAILKTRISASSPANQQPKTWDEYHRFYANVSFFFGQAYELLRTSS
jgi:hypothetical protein